MRISKRRTAAIAAAVSATFAIASFSPIVHAQSTGRRMIGIDVSDWQNQNGPTGDTPIDWATVRRPVSQGGAGMDFAFIRSSRGGTTGTYDEHAGTGTLAHRYDDFAFVYNITNATANGVLAGPYHFARADILTNTGADEADHMIQQAGAWMRPGYVLPVFDFEAGAAQRDPANLSQFAVDFANRIKQVKGVAPIVYINQSYAQSNEINSTVPPAMPVNWVARWPNQIYYDAVDHQNGGPIPVPQTANVYGLYNTAFPQVPTPEPWKFWQYNSRGRVPGIGGGVVAVDLDVAHGDIEFVKDHLVPAMWMTDASGDWSTLAQWNSDNPGYVAGNDATGPAPRLPNQIDTVILDRGAANPVITLNSGNHAVRKLFVREALNLTGGSLSVGYVPYTPAGGNFGSGPVSAQFSAPVSLAGSAALSVHTLEVDPQQLFTLNGGSLTFDTINLARHATDGGRIIVGGNVNITGLNGRTAHIVSTGAGAEPGSILLGGGTRTITVADGAAATDLCVDVAVQSGSLIKAGAGTMRLNGGVSALITVSGGTLEVAHSNVGNVTNQARVVFDMAANGAYGALMAGPGAFVKRGPGTLDITSALTLTGPVTVNDSTMRLAGAAGRLPLAASYTINAGTLALDNAAANDNDRLKNAGPINGHSATLLFNGSFTTEVAGPLSAQSGASTVALSGGNSSIAFAGLTRAPGATLNFTGVGGTVDARIATGVTPGAFLGQGVFVNGDHYAVTDAAGNVRPMTEGPGPDQYATTLAAGRHVKLDSLPLPNTPSISIKTLNLSGASVNVAMASGATLTLSDGGIFKSSNGVTTTSIGGAGAFVRAPEHVEFVAHVDYPGSVLNIDAAVTGGSGLTKTGVGTLVLNATNTYGGATSIVGGRLVTGPTGLAGGDIVISGGATLQVTGGALNTGRQVTLGPGGGAIDGDGTFNGVISGPGGLTKKGGTLVLNGAGNTYSGATVVAGGILVAGAGNLGDGSEANSLAISGGTLATLGPINTARPISLPSGNATIDTSGYDSTFSGVISGAGNLFKTGAGSLVLDGNAANTYSGSTVINRGTLVAASKHLGSDANGIVFSTGGRLRASDNFTTARSVSVNVGGGIIDTDGYAVTVSGGVAGNDTLTKSGFGQLTLTAANAHAAAVTVNNGTLRLAGPAGALATATGFTINGGGVLKLDNHIAAGGNSNDRISNTAPITMNGGALWLYGAPTTEQAGNLALASGYNQVILSGSTTSTLNFGGLTRSAGATVQFLGVTSTLRATFNSGVTAGAFIDPGAFVRVSEAGVSAAAYAVYDAGGYVRAMASGAGDSDFTSAITANRHVKLTATASGIGTESIYTLNLANTGTSVNATLAAGATLTLSKGGLLSFGATGNTISGGAAITSGTPELIVHTPEAVDLLTISTPITGAGAGLTKSGLGRLSLNSTSNSYGGATIVAGGTLRLSTSNVIPDASNVTLAHDTQLDLATRSETVGGTFTLVGSARVMSKNSDTLASGGTLTLAGANTTINYLGGGGGVTGAVIENATFQPGNAAGTATFNVADGDGVPDLAVRANIQDSGGARAINKTGASTLRLAGAANSFTGNVTITAGTIDVSGAITSGVGAVSIPAGGRLAGTGTVAKPTTLSGGVIDLSPGGTINTTLIATGGTWRGQGAVNGVVTVPTGTLTVGPGANLTANAGVNVTGGTIAAEHANSTITGSVNVTQEIDGTWGGNIAGGASTLTLNATGTLMLTSANGYGGGTTVNRGILLVAADGALGTGPVTTTMTVVTPGSGSGGVVRLQDNVTLHNPLSIGGGGLSGTSQTPPGSMAALDNLSGVNTWAGSITLNGTGNNIVDPLLNQIGASGGTLAVSGVISGGAGQTWAKTGHGDVVLTGAAPSTYANLTRLFGGRLIVEKDGALGAAGSSSSATGNTFQLAGSASTLAFRAPAGSPGLNYSTFEVINTDGTGAAGGFGQVDNLGGDNTFAGQIALAGPLDGSGRHQTSIGVSAGSLHVLGGIYARAAASAPRDIAKLGAGRLILSGDGAANTGNAGVVPLVNSTFNVNAGVVELRSPSAQQSNLPGVTTWNVNSGATVHLAAGQLATTTLNVAAGGNITVAPGAGKFLRAQQLNIATGGQIDLADSDMIVNYASGDASPTGTFDGTVYNGITGHLAASYNFGGWDAPGGITSSVAAAVAAGGGVTTLAIADASSAIGIGPDETWEWNGQTIDGSSVLVMYTYAGDVNLDGVVDGADYGTLDNWIQFPGTSGYANGDVNYDGVIDGADYGTLDNSIQLQGPPLGGASALIGAVTAVPEPAACAFAFIGATLARRRRRRH